MAKTTPKTIQNDASPTEFIAAVADEQKRADAQLVLKMMEEITGEPAKMWGPSIIGFGSYHYKYASGREGDWMLTGFSPRKTALTLYLIGGVDRNTELLEKLGKYKTGKSCLYLKKLSDVDLEVLRELITVSVEQTRKGDIRY